MDTFTCDVSVGFWESKPEIIIFFWEAEMLCYLGKMGQDIIAKVVNESRVIVNAVL